MPKVIFHGIDIAGSYKVGYTESTESDSSDVRESHVRSDLWLKTLIIAEKPDMGRNIAAAIEPKAKNMRSHLEGEQYIITWAIGHLIELAEPDHYDEKYKKWNINHLPIIPAEFKLIPNPRTYDQLKVIAELSEEM